jgi:hypothetical protein
MSHGLVDFDFISKSLFPHQTLLDGIGKNIRVGVCSYEAVLVPNLRTIRPTTLIRLQKSAAAGGKVFVIGESPPLVDAVGLLQHQTSMNALQFLEQDMQFHEHLALSKTSILTDAGSECQNLLYKMPRTLGVQPRYREGKICIHSSVPERVLGLNSLRCFHCNRMEPRGHTKWMLDNCPVPFRRLCKSVTTSFYHAIPSP